MDFYKKLVSSLILFPPLNSFPPFRSKEKLVSAETIQGNTAWISWRHKKLAIVWYREPFLVHTFQNNLLNIEYQPWGCDNWKTESLQIIPLEYYHRNQMLRNPSLQKGNHKLLMVKLVSILQVRPLKVEKCLLLGPCKKSGPW